ncbi:MAG: hypothetical protein K0R18_2490 [Bacillales bacterium]|nr:hypothetical protein [Bacillales bacterium]
MNYLLYYLTEEEKGLNHVKNKLSVYTNKVLTVISYLGLVILVTLPWSLKKFFPDEIEEGIFYWYMLITLYIAGSLACFIIRELVSILKSIINDNPFTYEIANNLKTISTLSIVIALLFLVKCFIFPTLYTFVVTIVFAIIGLMTQLFSELFKLATDVKNENDFTI